MQKSKARKPKRQTPLSVLHQIASIQPRGSRRKRRQSPLSVIHEIAGRE